MSNRTLIELNHDYADAMEKAEFHAALQRYLSCADRETADALSRFGARVVGMRHHSDKFVVDADAEGFPPHYLKGA